MSETQYYWACCGAPIGANVEVSVMDDGTVAREDKCPCGKSTFLQLDGGTLDLGLVRDEQLQRNDYQIFDSPPDA